MSSGVSPFIWLVGGTSESAQLARLLAEKGLPYVVTVTTTAAKRLYPDNTYVWVGQLTTQSVVQFIKKWQVRCILDASHPFACEISQLAMDCARSQSIAYLRYERPDVRERPSVSDTQSSEPISEPISESVHENNHTSDISLHNFPSTTDAECKGAAVLVDSITDLLKSDILRGQRVLFTVGYRYLSLFSDLRPNSQLFARILPSEEAIAGATAAGFSAAEIIALRPPVSADLELALWQQWNITRVVAKASGKPSGEGTKRAIAAELGIPLILIKRPQITYSNRTIYFSEAIEFCCKMLKVYYPNA